MFNSFFSSVEVNRIIAATIIMCSVLIDLFDGYVARKYHFDSVLRRILDFSAEKLTIVLRIDYVIYAYNQE
ncbi:CDP-alcohol phosphatidyltransferase family protein [Natroniella sp. ANB-PHB2]|uniref:CDP-alcohol phosphatidyltransferase family protein n=1 Tax=Natroniella sp. ANB-PHB2 TaxID=3384444 RepID=UPI0038D37E6E